MRCAIIHNPAAGRNRLRKDAQLREIARSLSDIGHFVELIETTASGSAAMQARDAIANGAEIVFAGGGDGTVHDVLQGYMAHAVNSHVCMGILPMGSANALARHLGLSLNPAIAALQQVTGETVSLPVGKLASSSFCRYFSVMAGMGPDGLLTYKVLTTHKSGLGRFAYYLHAARLFATNPFPPFEVQYYDPASQAHRSRQAVSLMAVRIDDLGGLFSRLIPHEDFDLTENLRLVLLTPPSLLSLPLWFLFGWLGLHRWNPFLHSLAVNYALCKPLSSEPHFQADGEWLGRGSIELSLVPKALRLRLPISSLAELR